MCLEKNGGEKSDTLSETELIVFDKHYPSSS